jgi:integrase
MASIFKRRKAKNEPYWIQYKDHLGKRKTAKGFTDKGLTEELAAKLESEVRLRKTGLVDHEQEKFNDARLAPIEDQLAAFQASRPSHLQSHDKMILGRIRRVLNGANIAKLADLSLERVQAYLQTLQKTKKIANRTYNHYRDALFTFCNWCITTDRLMRNPIKALANLNEQTDVRRPRRALAPEEMSLLVEATRTSEKYAQKLSPEYRARLYTFAFLTGLRRKEIASLTASSFRLDDDPPTLAVEAADSKHRRKDLLPLHHELVVKLRVWLAGLKPSDKLFPGLARKDTAKLIKADLKRAGLEYRSIEGFADFHATRHTYITQLLRSGASLPVTKELARHSNVNQTMQYTHIGINDRAKAVSNLPSLQASPKPPSAANPGEDAALQMRCNSGGAAGHSPSTDGTADAASDRNNPKQDKGFGKNCHRLTLSGKTGASGLRPASPQIVSDAFARII